MTTIVALTVIAVISGLALLAVLFNGPHTRPPIQPPWKKS